MCIRDRIISASAWGCGICAVFLFVVAQTDLGRWDARSGFCTKNRYFAKRGTLPTPRFGCMIVLSVPNVPRVVCRYGTRATPDLPLTLGRGTQVARNIPVTPWSGKILGG